MVTIKKTERRGKGRKAISEQTRDDIVKMYKAGISVKMIIQKHGVSKTSVYRILDERTVSDE